MFFKPLPRWSRRLLSEQFPRFLAAGGLAALANFASRFLFSEFMRFEYAVTCAFFVGLSSGFMLNRHFVFRSSANSLGKEMLYYFLVNMLALMQTWLLSVVLAQALTPQLGQQFGQAIAHIAGIMLPTLTSYLGHKYFTFRERDS
ncbi:MAG: GtrA family protein [Lysobacterales bacterium]